MTPEQIKSMNEWLAVEVMMWRVIKDTESYPYDTGDTYGNDKDNHIMYVVGWQPDKNPEQALMVLDTFPDLSFDKRDGVWSAAIGYGTEDNNGVWYPDWEQGDSFCLAACIAAAKASGWEGCGN